MYTRRGDKGETDTGTGVRVTKGSHIIDAEGDIDELNSFIGFALVNAKWDDIRNDLMAVQEDLFTCGEHITAQGKRRTIKDERVRWLEERIDIYRKEYGKIKLFVVPGGSVESTSLHMARTVCRRLERDLVKAKDEFPVEPVIEQYINRLSSLLFFHSLIANRRLGIEERIWYLRELP
ncbi:MAG: cob(I)yrinic acid a,c-diamide adenosyltransferase [Candidatus Thermoplasmatota archaeon]|nr:cob(I)yrinic acid a,c-diamide adenosyltransferase [Candidatus Thermoplasmatota archaeon]